MNWSGGKDAALCLHRVLRHAECDIASLLTTVNRHYGRVSQHGVRVELVEEQAAQIGLPLETIEMPRYPSMETYDRLMAETLSRFKDREITTAIFGDILLEDLRAYREEKLETAGFRGVFPLWKKPTDRLVREFLAAGFKAVIVCVNEQHLGKSFAGREFDEALLDDLPDGVDLCGENGEFHTFVYDGPLFKRPVNFTIGETIHRTYDPPAGRNSDDPCGSGDEENLRGTGFWYCDLLPDEISSSGEQARAADIEPTQPR